MKSKLVKCKGCGFYLIPFGDLWIHPPNNDCSQNADGFSIQCTDPILANKWKNRYGVPKTTYNSIIQSMDKALQQEQLGRVKFEQKKLKEIDNIKKMMNVQFKNVETLMIEEYYNVAYCLEYHSVYVMIILNWNWLKLQVTHIVDYIRGKND